MNNCIQNKQRYISLLSIHLDITVLLFLATQFYIKENLCVCKHVLVMLLVIDMIHESVVWTNLAAVCKCDDVGWNNLAPE